MSLLAVVQLFSSMLLFSWPALGSASTTVTRLPWFDGPLPFHLETGYVEVDKVMEANMFYYFVKSERNPAEDPLILWHNGGPGCSALYGFVLEIGPLRVDVAAHNEGKPCLVYNPYTWTKTSNIIFVDAPIGTGFSYSKDPDYQMTDSVAALQLHAFLEKWLIDHPEFSTNPLYIGGDSYAGKIVPIIVQEIVNGKQTGNNLSRNLKGYVIGNPPTDSRFDSVQIKYAHGMGIISDELYETVQNCPKVNHEFPHNLECLTSTLTGLNLANILDPPCSEPYLIIDTATTDAKSFLPVECRNSTYHLLQLWPNMDSVREAFNVRKGKVKHWERCREDMAYTRNIASTVIYHQNLTARGYRALVYSGDHDMEFPHIGTQAWIRSLNFPIVDSWRPWFVNNQVAGYTRSYSNNLTFATVKGAGHAAPEYQPKECQAMFSRWISYVPL